MPSKPPSASRFRSAYSRQIALWILRAFATGPARRCFFTCSRSSSDDDSCYADDDVATFLGLPAKAKRSDTAKVFNRMDQLRISLESDPRPIGLPQRTIDNLERLGEALKLTAEEKQLLGLFICLKLDSNLSDAWGILGGLPHQEPGRFFLRVLGIPRRSVDRALDANGTLRRCRILNGTLYRGYLRLSFDSESVAAHLLKERYNPEKVLKEFRIKPSSPANLELVNYPHLREPIDLIIAYLRNAVAEGRHGVNIFLHGVPGTGKTELTRTIGKALGLPVYEVETSEERGKVSGPEERLKSLDFADSVLSSNPALFVFDEAEDVFSSSLLQRSVASTHKGWFNSMLERNQWPVFWVSNQIRGLDPAFVRRFDMVLEVPVPPKSERHRLVSAAVGDIVGEELAGRIASVKTIAPAVLARAANVVRRAGDEISVSMRAAALTRLLGDTLTAQGHPDPFRANVPAAACGTYDPFYLNTPCDLAAIARQLRSVEGARLCLYGPPGTGKTAFGHWLASELDRPLFARRASDLLGKYVGETEERISEAFEEATRDNAILLLDEVDSFLAIRDGAQRSWEITSVNEMLTQIESFPGLLIATTNRLEALDPASLRRFDLKVGFDYLRGDQVEALLVAQSLHFGFSRPDKETLFRAGLLTTCTPGDFAAVARRHRFDPFESAREMLAAVCNEIRHRTPVRHPIGFA